MKKPPHIFIYFYCRDGKIDVRSTQATSSSSLRTKGRASTFDSPCIAFSQITWPLSQSNCVRIGPTPSSSGILLLYFYPFVYSHFPLKQSLPWSSSPLQPPPQLFPFLSFKSIVFKRIDYSRWVHILTFTPQHTPSQRRLVADDVSQFPSFLFMLIFTASFLALTIYPLKKRTLWWDGKEFIFISCWGHESYQDEHGSCPHRTYSPLCLLVWRWMIKSPSHFLDFPCLSLSVMST